MKAAIDNGADVNEEDEDGETKLMLALYYHHTDVVQLLLNHPQIDINKVDCYERCALHHALLSPPKDDPDDPDGNHEGMEALLARQDLTTINQGKSEGRTPIMEAVAYKMVNCFKLLLAHPQIDPNQKDRHDLTPIMRAVYYNNVNCINLLLAHPEVDLDTRDDYQRSPEEVQR